jgi:hypothetical protein
MPPVIAQPWRLPALRGQHLPRARAGVAYVCLVLLGFNCVLNTITSSWSGFSKWSGSSLVKSTASLAVDGINVAATTYDKYLLASDPFMTVKVRAWPACLTGCCRHLPAWQRCAPLAAGDGTAAPGGDLHPRRAAPKRTLRPVQVILALWALGWMGAHVR